MATAIQTTEEHGMLDVSGLPLPEQIKQAAARMAALIPRYASTEPGAATLIESTRAIASIEDADTYALIRDLFLPALQAQIKAGEAHHKPYKQAFDGAHGIACKLEKEDVADAKAELERCKKMIASSPFAEREKFIENVDKMALIGAAISDARYRKYLSIDMAALATQLAADGEFFDVPGVTVGERGKSPVIRSAK